MPTPRFRRASTSARSTAAALPRRNLQRISLENSRWIITTVNGKAVANPADFYREVGKSKGPYELRLVEARGSESTARTVVLP